VVSDYQFDTNRETYQHYRKVQWLTTNKVHVARAADIITKALTDISYGNWLSYVDEIAAKLGIELEALPPVPAATVMAHKPSMNKPTNVILYGPPGTGKTFHTKEHAVVLCNGKATPAALKEDFAKLVADKRVAFVTFHQSYDYSDFIIGFKPVPSANGMSFEVRKGVLMRLAEEAEKNQHLPYLLIIDEINRGNISKIFGELITLIEADKRRDGDFPLEVTLPCAYKGNDGKETCQFSLPSNVHLLGTMNTADRSIALLDTALRRRFKFVRKEPNPDLLHADLDGVKLPKLLTKLNVILTEAFSPDHQIGHAWMPMKFDAKATGADLIAAFEDKILPLLDEWYYDDANGKEALLAQLTDKGEVTIDALKKFSES
jgi:5-methylcytosine-specific restriction protein B